MNATKVRPSFAQLRFLRAVARLVESTGAPVRLGDAMTEAGLPTVQRRTVDACRRFGWVVADEGPPRVWDLTDAGRAEVAK